MPTPRSCGGSACNQAVAEVDLAVIGILQARHQPGQRRLAGSGRAQNIRHLARTKLERRPVDGGEGAESLLQTFQDDADHGGVEVLSAARTARLRAGPAGDSTIPLASPGRPFLTKPGTKPRFAAEPSFGRLASARRAATDRRAAPVPASFAAARLASGGSGATSSRERLDQGHRTLALAAQVFRHRGRRPRRRLDQPLERLLAIGKPLDRPPRRPELVLRVNQRRSQQVGDQRADFLGSSPVERLLRSRRPLRPGSRPGTRRNPCASCSGPAPHVRSPRPRSRRPDRPVRPIAIAGTLAPPGRHREESIDRPMRSRAAAAGPAGHNPHAIPPWRAGSIAQQQRCLIATRVAPGAARAGATCAIRRPRARRPCTSAPSRVLRSATSRSMLASSANVAAGRPESHAAESPETPASADRPRPRRRATRSARGGGRDDRGGAGPALEVRFELAASLRRPGGRDHQAIRRLPAQHPARMQEHGRQGERPDPQRRG